LSRSACKTGLLLAGLTGLLLTAACAGGAPLTTDPRSLLTATAPPVMAPLVDQPPADGEASPLLDYPPPVRMSAYQGTPPPPPPASLPVYIDGWQVLAEGVGYRVFSEVPGTADPVHVARLQRRSNPELTIDTLKGGGVLQPWVLEGLDGQVARYDDALNYWGDLGSGGDPYWGKRNRVLVAINGSLFDTSTTRDKDDVILTQEGLPNQGMVMSGWYIDRFQDFQNRSGFVWAMDQRVFFGGCVEHPPSDQAVQLDMLNPDSQVKITGINIPRDADRGLFLYTPHHGATTGQEPKPNSLSVEVVVRMYSPLLITPENEENLINGGRARGEIVEVRRNQPPAPMEFDQVVLSAYGFNAEKLLSLTQGREGLTVAFSQSIEDSPAENCSAHSGKRWSEAYAALGVDASMVENGEALIPRADGISPRTTIAFNNEYIYFVVAEGRPVVTAAGEPARTGISLWDLANFLVDRLEAEWAYNLDGGGSATMYIDGQIVTRPGDSLPMVCSQGYYPLVSRAPGGQAYPAPEEAGRPLANTDLVYGHTSRDGICQRPLINAIAMIAVEPMIKNTRLHSGQPVVAQRRTALRQGPGTNFLPLDHLPTGSLATIGEPGSELNGIYASGTYWWYVVLDAQRGWVDERDLAVRQ
jgi:hypothetical protein